MRGRIGDHHCIVQRAGHLLRQWGKYVARVVTASSIVLTILFMILIDVLLTEQLLEIFQSAAERHPDINVVLLPGSSVDAEVPLGDRGVVVRVEAASGEVLMVSAREVARLVGGDLLTLVDFHDLVGYDWISPDLEEKVALKDRFYDRLFVYLSGERTVTLASLGEAVYPLMTFLGKVLEVRSQKVLLRGLDEDVVEVLGRCLKAAVEGPFFRDDELDQLFAQDRGSLALVASMWTRMNLASPDLRRTVQSVAEMLLERRDAHPDAWNRLVDADPVRVRSALEVFSRVVTA